MSSARPCRRLVPSTSSLHPSAAVNVVARPTSMTVPGGSERSGDTSALSIGSPTAIVAMIAATTIVPGQPRRSRPRNPRVIACSVTGG